MNASTLKQLTELALAFRDERDWKQFHNFKDMALSLTLEVAELSELMQWKNGDELNSHLAANREHAGEELSDILHWVLLIASDLEIDLDDAFRRKMVSNAAKYPVAKSKGRATNIPSFDHGTVVGRVVEPPRSISTTAVKYRQPLPTKS